MSAGVIAASYVAGGVTPGSGGQVATLTVPAGKVASTQTNFVTRVDLSHMPADWWTSTTSDLGNVRAKQAGTVIPFDVIRYDRVRRTGELFFKATLTTSANVFTLETVAGATALAVTDTNGRNAVWSDYDAMFVFPDLTNRNGSGNNASKVGTAYDIGPVSKTGPYSSHQGVAIDDSGNFYVIDTNKITKYDPNWTLLATNSDPIGGTGIASVNHLGDGSVVGGELFLPVEVYPSGPYTNQHIGVWNLSDLSFNRSYDISAQGHEASGVCFNPDDNCFYVTSYLDAGVIYKYDSSFGYIGTVTLSTSVSNKQSIAHHDGKLYFTSDNTDGIHQMNADGTGVTTIFAGELIGSGSAEGLDFAPNGDLYMVFINSAATVNYVYRFLPGLGAVKTGNVVATGLTKRTSWTIAASVCNAPSSSPTQTFMSYSDNSATDANRAGLGNRGAGAPNFGAWNSTDSWLNDPGSSPATEDGKRHRWNYTHDATVSRKIWRDGALVATDNTVGQRPVSASTTAVFFGAEDTTASERFGGWLNYAYLRNGIPSAGWFAAEYASWENPATFYAIT